MWRPIASAGIALLAALATADPASTTAARVGDEEIPLTAVDALAAASVRDIHARLAALARDTSYDLVDERLGIEAEAEPPDISEQAIDRFRRERAAQLRLPAAPAIPPHAEREAIRFFLERERRRSEIGRRRSELYRAHRVQLLPPSPALLESGLPASLPIARVDGAPVAAAELEHAAALRLYRLRGELYLLRRRHLERLIEQHLLDAEAQERGLPLQRLLQNPDPPSDAEVQAFVARRRAAGDREAVAARARPYLEFLRQQEHRERLLQALRARTEVHIALEPPAPPRLPIRTEDGVPLGSSAGPVLVAYTNYHCRLCRATHRELDRLLAAGHPPRLVLRDFIPAYDPAATEAAALVRCAAQRNRHARVRAALLAAEPPPFARSWLGSAEQARALARLAGLQPEELRSCAASASVLAQIRRDTEEAQRLGFDAAPAFVAAGAPLSGMQSASLLQLALEGRAPGLAPGEITRER